MQHDSENEHFHEEHIICRAPPLLPEICPGPIDDAQLVDNPVMTNLHKRLNKLENSLTERLERLEYAVLRIENMITSSTGGCLTGLHSFLNYLVDIFSLSYYLKLIVKFVKIKLNVAFDFSKIFNLFVKDIQLIDNFTLTT